MPRQDQHRDEPPPTVDGSAGALRGIRVLDAATFVAAPFCGTILADFGAEVIKIEQPKVGDPLRRFGTETESGDSLVWLSEARNKRAITLDLRTERGAELFRRLVAKSDVVIENFRPGTMERWGLGYDALAKINPRIIMLRVSAYGQTGPKKDEPGFARIAHAFGGLSYLTGEPGGPPGVPGSTSLADYISGMWGAIGVLVALHALGATGTGQFIDIGLYEAVFRLLDEIAPAFAKFGIVRERMGPDTINVVPHSHYRTATGEWVAIACTSDKMFRRLCDVMGRPELAAAYPMTAQRVAHREHVNEMVGAWVGGLSYAEVMARTIAGEVPCGPLYSIKEIFDDPQYIARGNLMAVTDPRVGPLVLPAAVPRLSATPATFNHAGRALGADNKAVFGGVLGLSEEEISTLGAAGVI